MSAPRWLAGVTAATVSLAVAGAVALVPQGTAVASAFTTDSAGTATVFVHGWYAQGAVFAADVTIS